MAEASAAEASAGEVFEWGNVPRQLLEELAHESLTYWRTPGSKPPALPLLQILDRVSEAALHLRPEAEVDGEIAAIVRSWYAHEQPGSTPLQENAHLRALIAERTRPRAGACPPAPSWPGDGDGDGGEEWICIGCAERNVTRCDADRCCITCGMDLSERSELLRFLGAEGGAEEGSCGSCAELRRRLVNIYHLTLNTADEAEAIVAIRSASSPGAAAPAPEEPPQDGA